MLLADLVAASDAVAASTSRRAKVEAIAGALAQAGPELAAVVAPLLAGEARQRRIGIGWATVSSISVPPAGAPVLTVGDLDAALDRLGSTTGPGSAGARAGQLEALFARATPTEQHWLRRLLVGEVRQGALESLVADAVARATGTGSAVVRRALMLSGDLGFTARVAAEAGEAGLGAIGLRVGRGILPTLASPAESVARALAELGPSSVTWKLDGVRVQVHRRGEEVRVFTRNLNDVTHRLPAVVAVARSLPADRAVLDGEAMAVAGDRPIAFQELMSSFGREGDDRSVALAPFFFDCLHVDGRDLIDETLETRLGVLMSLAPAHLVPGTTTADVDEAAAVLDEALAAGHEGVVVKALPSRYEAGRRGKAWRKVKPVRTFDLVVLAAEWGHGRRTGWLSNLHLGARGPGGTFVMVGKTFKGLTDDLLRWQTEALQRIAVSEQRHVVHVRPELVVEVAIDGVQRSTRYPGGVALRFARVRRYRGDKAPADADPIEALQSLL